MKNDKYMVLVEGRGEPKKFHPDYRSAMDEAERLIRLEKRTVYVLKIVSMFEITQSVTITNFHGLGVEN